VDKENGFTAKSDEEDAKNAKYNVAEGE